MAFPVSGSQTRGGRKGGLAICEGNGLLAKPKGTLSTGNAKTTKEYVPATPKQFIGQVAMDEQQPSRSFSEDGLLWGQQSMSSMEDNMFDISADFAAADAAAPALAGSTATDKTSKKTRIILPTCMNHALCSQNTRYPAVVVK
jgi:hypothetical protein